MTKNYLLILLLGLISCESQNKKVNITNPQFRQIEFVELELKEICKVSRTGLNSNMHGNNFIDTKENRLVSNDTLRNQLELYSNLDNFSDNNSFVCLWGKRLVWEYKKKTNILKIERVETKDSLNDIELLDYNIFFVDNLNFTTIRFLNKKELIEIFDEKNEIRKEMESIPIGFVELTRRQDSINIRTITCR